MSSTVIGELTRVLLDSGEKAFDLTRRERDRWHRFQALAFPLDPARPRWATLGRIVPLKDSVQLRTYGRRTARSIPALVVTPQVNHSYIADFSPDQSLVRTLREGGLAQVGVTDWLPPPKRPYSIADSVDDICDCIDRMGGRVHLVGLCQGGWQSVIVAALYPERVESLTLAAAPVDTQAGWSPVRLFVEGLPMVWYEGLVAGSGGVAPGSAISAGFDLLRAHERFALNYLDLWLHLDDPDYCSRYEALRNWYRLRKDVAGQLYIEVVRDLFKQNLLCRNRMVVGGRRVDLSAICCPIYLVAGTRDHITPPEQVFALESLAPKAPAKRFLVDAGHIGVFMGRTALSTVWPELAGTCYTSRGG